MGKEEVLNKARSDHSRQEPRRQLLERNAGYLLVHRPVCDRRHLEAGRVVHRSDPGTASINGLLLPAF
ncbi:MAG: hypothetical protein ACLTCB_01850 [Merdibacter sp.]